ncbi:MAG: FkbM family methyltransferase [Actinomycetes bacterium]
MSMLTRVREYRRSNSVHTFPDRVAMFLNSISTIRKSQTIGHLNVAELNSQLGKNPVIVEVGSFNGKDTLRLARNLTNASVYGFEPVPELYSVAVRRCLKAKNVRMLQLAASNFNGWTSLNVSDGTSRASSSILDPNPLGKFFRGINFDNQQRVHVATIKLSDWFDEAGLEKIDLLWIDVQGAEGLVLQGLEEKLNLVKMIYSEINFEETYAGAVLFEDVKIFLEERGFTLEQVWRDGPAGDALFIRN